MRPFVIRLLLAFGVSLELLQAATSFAQEGAASDGELERWIEQGIELRRAGSDRDALAAFQRAEKLAPESARVQVHLGATHQALGQWLRAEEYLQRAVAQSSDPYVVRHRATLEAAQRAIREHVGRLEIDGGPVGAEVKLDGHLKGTLPLDAPIKVVAGAYTLEVTQPGYYAVRRQVILAGGRLVRESVRLAPGAPAGPGATRVPAAQAIDGRGSRSRWLTWTLAGLSGAAVGVSVVAWSIRERHADRWNDDAACLRPGLTRGEVCGGELDDGERAEAFMLGGAVAAGLLAASAVLTVVLDDDDEQAPGLALSCGFSAGLSAAGAHCAAGF